MVASELFVGELRLPLLPQVFTGLPIPWQEVISRAGVLGVSVWLAWILSPSTRERIEKLRAQDVPGRANRLVLSAPGRRRLSTVVGNPPLSPTSALHVTSSSPTFRAGLLNQNLRSRWKIRLARNAEKLKIYK